MNKRLLALESEKSSHSFTTEECPCDLTLIEDQIRFNTEEIVNVKVDMGVLGSKVDTFNSEVFAIQKNVQVLNEDVQQTNTDLRSLDQRVDVSLEI